MAVTDALRHVSSVSSMGCGSNVTEKWAAEGRRLIPLLPRLVPQTAFTATATAAANTQADRNMSMTPPAKTGNRDREGEPPTRVLLYSGVARRPLPLQCVGKENND